MRQETKNGFTLTGHLVQSTHIHLMTCYRPSQSDTSWHTPTRCWHPLTCPYALGILSLFHTYTRTRTHTHTHTHTHKHQHTHTQKALNKTLTPTHTSTTPLWHTCLNTPRQPSWPPDTPTWHTHLVTPCCFDNSLHACVPVKCCMRHRHTTSVLELCLTHKLTSIVIPVGLHTLENR